ncbi:metal-dependent hydrolase [Patescibacteria group bacterium]|nr:metal-dependent hydrolase [Patescibacteria group bacterium]
MLPPSHLLSSVFILRILSLTITPIPYDFKTVILSITFHMLPDLDIFWAKKLNSHHVTYLHSPLFWIFTFLIFYFVNSLFDLFGNWVLYLYITQIILHLLFDFITGRAGGIPLLYPFVKKEFSFLPLNKAQGDFQPFNIKETIKFLKYYFTSKGQIAFELSLCVLGIISIAF